MGQLAVPKPEAEGQVERLVAAVAYHHPVTPHLVLGHRLGTDRGDEDPGHLHRGLPRLGVSKQLSVLLQADVLEDVGTLEPQTRYAERLVGLRLEAQYAVYLRPREFADYP